MFINKGATVDFGLDVVTFEFTGTGPGILPENTVNEFTCIFNGINIPRDCKSDKDSLSLPPYENVYDFLRLWSLNSRNFSPDNFRRVKIAKVAEFGEILSCEKFGYNNTIYNL